MSDTPAISSPDETRGRRPPRVVSVLAGAGALLALVGLLALVSPTVREQVALSTTRQDAPFVETYVVDPITAAACNAGRPRFRALVGVRSHLDEPQRLSYVLNLVPLDGGPTRSVPGDLATSPGEETIVVVAGRKPAGPYDAEVLFPSLGQRLLVHCQGGAS